VLKFRALLIVGPAMMVAAGFASAQEPTEAVVAKLASRSFDERRMAVRELAFASPNAAADTRSEPFTELKQLDERATAALIEARADPSPQVRAWAKDVLDALGRRTPGDAVQTTNDQTIIDVLRAYAGLRDVDALPVVLSFVNSNRAQVRTAAREATLAYGADALGKLRSTYAALTGERLPEDASVDEVARSLFTAYDHHRLHDVYARLDDGLAKFRSGDLDGAIAEFENVLARQPLLDRRQEITPAYVMYGEALEQTDRARATDYLRRALRLDEEGHQSKHVRAELLYLEGEELFSRGIADPHPLEEALLLDPGNVHARTKLESLRADAAWRRGRETRFAVSVTVVGVALLATGVAALLRRRPA
jgi:hypothetical protein